VAVEQDQLADTGAVDALADLGPDADQGFRRQRQGTGESLMLVGFADRHHRQNQDRQVFRDLRNRPPEDAAIYGTVHPDRQMRTMLFDGADRKHGNRVFTIDSREILGRQILPVAAPRSNHETSSP
jgi:hypothetical protein